MSETLAAIGGPMGDEPQVPFQVRPGAIRLRTNDPKAPPDQELNVVPAPDSPVTDVPDALPSDAAMSQEVEAVDDPFAITSQEMMAVTVNDRTETGEDDDVELIPVLDASPPTDEDSAVRGIYHGDRGQDVQTSRERANERTRQLAAERKAKKPRNGIVSRKPKAPVDDVPPEMRTIEGQVAFVVASLREIVDLTGAPFGGSEAAPHIQTIKLAVPKLSGDDVGELTRVICGIVHPEPLLLRQAVRNCVRLHEQSELRRMAAEISVDYTDQVPQHVIDEMHDKLGDHEPLPEPTFETMAPFWDLVPELTRPEGRSAIAHYAEASDLLTSHFPRRNMSEEDHTALICDAALVLTGTPIQSLEEFDLTVRRLRGEQVPPVPEFVPLLDDEEALALSDALSKSFVEEPLISPEERDALDHATRPEAVFDALMMETELPGHSPRDELPSYPEPLLRPLPPSVRRREREARELDKKPEVSKKEERPVRKVKREQLVPASALWTFMGLLIALICVVAALLMRADAVNRQASEARDAAQDEEITVVRDSLHRYADTLASVVDTIEEKDTKILRLESERDGYEGLAIEAVEVVDGLRTDVNQLERATKLRISVLDQKVQAMQQDRSRERDLTARIEASEAAATEMVRGQDCPRVGTGTLTTGQQGTVFQCVAGGAKQFVVCIGENPATAHSCQMTTAPK